VIVTILAIVIYVCGVVFGHLVLGVTNYFGSKDDFETTFLTWCAFMWPIALPFAAVICGTYYASNKLIEFGKRIREKIQREAK
jgi:hypothetical protein